MPLPPSAPGSTCLVNGASSGIGAQIARALARRGQGVILVARRAERLEQLASELGAEHGVRAETIAGQHAPRWLLLRTLGHLTPAGR